ncbi:MAG TPA: D-alanine--D-alanine ligase family protein [Chloroflexota bacterium]|nr:D-alanine--D-alanine ligase family protein [Chloroflexota bacterium]
MKKIRVGVLFGGQSGEHEVSLASAASVLEALDREKYEAVPIGITRGGQWLIADSPQDLLRSEVTLELPGTDEAIPDVTHHSIVRVDRRGVGLHDSAVDVVFPLLHGPLGEDGTVQGLFELADIPYVGSGVLGAAVSMDKVMMKAVLAQSGLPGVPYRLIQSVAWARDRDEILGSTMRDLQTPLFVKPCNLGSSVGISKIHDVAELASAIDVALRYDRRVIVEQGVDAREIECSVLGNDAPLVSVPGEIRSHHDWYDYESKYTDGLADLVIPAELEEWQVKTAQEYARRAFQAVDAAGLARVDFFVRRDNGQILVNEINTMPGFTSTSMYPKLWEASGVSYPELIDRLIRLAIDRHDHKKAHREMR